MNEQLDKIVLLHDGDIFAYRAASVTDGRQYLVTWGDDGATTQFKYKKEADKFAKENNGTVTLIFEPEPLKHAQFILQKLMQKCRGSMLKHGVIAEQETFLTRKGSFREKDVSRDYKQNRKDVRRPEHLEDCKVWLEGTQYKAQCRPGELEADDMLTIRAEYWKAKGYTPVIVSVDKDLKQWSGWHYDFVNDKLVFVTEDEALRNFYSQLLMGDKTDNIIGIKGIGPKTAAKILAPCITSYDMYITCLQVWLEYLEQEPDEAEDNYHTRVILHVRMNARLLYLLRKEGEHWEAPNE